MTIMSLLPPRAATNTPPIPDIAAGKPKGNRPPPVVKQVQVSGDGSVSIQSGRDINVTISGSNGSVAAWSTTGDVNVGTRPPPRPIQWDTDHLAKLSWKATTRNLIGTAALLVLHTGLLALALTILLTGNPQWATYAGLVLNPAAMALHAHRLRSGIRERVAARTAYTPGCRCRRCSMQAWLDAEKAYEVSKPPPLPLPIWTWGTRTFAASCDCPRCGAIATHHLRTPGADDPAFADGVVIRTCTTCGQEWTER
ncbi:hypothetical protein [Mycolicibacterium sp. A43C]